MRRYVPTVIVEQRTLLREGLAALLHDSHFKVVTSVATVEDLPPLAPGRPGLLIVGVAKGEPGNLKFLERISPLRQDYKLVAIADGTGASGQLDISQILRSRADGYILNIQSRDVLLKSLELAVLEQKLIVLGEHCEAVGMSEPGAKPVAPPIALLRTNGNGAAHPPLSERELEILGCLACGGSNKIIARTCRIAESTVKIHLKSILRKIQVQNRTQAAIWAIQHNLAHLRHSPPVAPTELPSHSLPELFALGKLPESEPELD